MLLGCVGPGPRGPSGPPRPIVEFPSAAALAAVQDGPAELPLVVTAEVPAEGWAVEPDGQETSSDSWIPHGPWEEAIAASFSASGKKALPTRAMSCVAKELGRFVLAHDGQPPGEVCDRHPEDRRPLEVAQSLHLALGILLL